MKFKKIKQDLFSNNSLFFKNPPQSYVSRDGDDRRGNKSDEKEQKINFKESGEAKEEKKAHKSKKTEEHKLKSPKKNRLIKKMSKGKNIRVGTKKTFKIFNLKGISKTLKDEELISILEYLEKRNYQIKKEILNKEFSSETELYEFLKEDLINFLKNEYTSLKEKISLLRKHGKDVNYEWLKLLMIPSKISIFESNLSRKDFDKVIKIIDSLEDELKKYEEDPEKSK